MRQELLAGVDYIKTVGNRFQKLDSAIMDIFGEHLSEILCKKYTGHWYPENPMKGQAYRCIRINGQDKDESIQEACALSQIRFYDLALPKEFTLWIDPFEVSCRLGEENFPYTVVSFDPRSPRVKDVSVGPEEDQHEASSSCMVDCAIQVHENVEDTISSSSSSPRLSDDEDSGIDEAPNFPVEQIWRNTGPDQCSHLRTLRSSPSTALVLDSCFDL
ncbi:maternal B9.10 protein-like [Phyllobates terribilis]|uniref:maternal B9.10 protein-like n=1 Tax=Phyllobates terribilis TaxID=111132 RepID=UPI003CCB46B1